ncbi:hypothetical protein AB0M43_36285 [Longispora sp. NPDC051575]|uniref:hypothetical protein n=1 Tax=Longispora sp. NPDC051575 TaxID=3154943 RepID=UPI003442817D
MKLTKVLVVACLLLTACGTHEDSNPPAGGTASTPQPGGRSGFPSGLVVLGDPQGSPSSATMVTELRVHHPATGITLATYTLPGVMSKLSREQFSADFRSLVWVDCQLHLARLNGTAYVEVASWKPAVSFTSGAPCFYTPRFDPADGQIKAIGGAPGPDSDSSLFAFDPAHAEQAPRDLGIKARGLDNHGRQVRATNSWTVSGAPDDTVTLRVSDDALISGTVLGFHGYHYTCDQSLSPTTLLCLSGEKNAQAGSVAVLTADRQANTITLRQVAPVTDARVSGAVVAPDGRQVMLHTSTGWYVLPVDGSGAPSLAFQEVDRRPIGTVEVQFWS